MTKSLYKILGAGGVSVHGGNMTWSLPVKNGRKWTPGDWHSVKPPISVCSHGLHLVTRQGLMSWYKPKTTIYLAEGKGEQSKDTEKIAFERARLLRPAIVQFPAYWRKAIGFIEKEIPLVKFCEPDGKPLKEWLLFEAGNWAAAWAAAWDAARDAARDAAWDAAWDAARDAARDAAGAAARDAAGAAAGDAAWDAAWDAAGDAAWDAAGAAALYVHAVYICDGLNLDKKHIAHAKARWQVWQKGYALLCDVSGVLYVYAKKQRGGIGESA